MAFAYDFSVSDVRMCGFERRTPVAAALRVLEERVGVLESEIVAVRDAPGRVAAVDVHAAVAVPHFARSMMDGYAVVAESTQGASEYRPERLKIVGRARAGHATDATVHRGQAVSVTTGAPLPSGADAVVMAELTHRDGDDVLVTEAVSPGRHVGAIGEDIAVGDCILARGRVLRPQDAGVLASASIATVEVVRRPRVRIVVTGDELVAPDEAADGVHIVDANSIVLEALLKRDGGELSDVVRVPDDRAAVRGAMAESTADVLLLSGGSSVGPEDHAPLVLAELGEVLVHGVAMRPSSPAGFGSFGKRLVFLLPGNPVSCLCAYEFFAGPTLRALGGRARAWPHRRVRVPAAAKFVSVLGRTDYTRVVLEARGARPLMTSGASILSSTTRADGVVIVPDEREGYDEGEEVEVLLYDAP